MPLALTDAQLAYVMDAASLLPSGDRDNFMRSIAGRLKGTLRTNDKTLAKAVSDVLAMRGIAVGRQFFLDGPRGGHHGEPSHRRRLTRASPAAEGRG
jgi:hypothetical protein